MATALPEQLDPRPRAGKRGFAKRARGFAKRAVALPGFRYLWLASFAAMVLMVVTGGFNTGQLPMGRRVAFWALLLGWNAVKWQAWFAFTVRHPRDWTRAALIGTLLLNLLLPVEIGVVLGIMGLNSALDPASVWLRALAIGLGIFPMMWVIARQLRPRAPIAVAPPAEGGLLDRAKIAPEALIAIQAEDHYCRVRGASGSDALVHYRFGDALGEVAGLDGAQVHRGAWVAAGAVKSAARDGRRWLLVLTDGSQVAVSATHLPAIRAKGWLSR